jgi:anti-sigma regulatory factor (Ser/Thr protein kinase)
MVLTNANTFQRSRLAADASAAGLARTEFDLWLRRHFRLSATGRADLTLAVNEALANAAEHAYQGRSERGTVDVDAQYDPAADTLTVTVEDHGQWQPTAQDSSFDAGRCNPRGRGIPLMRTLADHTAIDSDSCGTRVCLTWRHVESGQAE